MLGRELGRMEVWVLLTRKAPSPPTTSSLTVLGSLQTQGSTPVAPPNLTPSGAVSTSICKALFWFPGTQPCPSKSPPPRMMLGLVPG